MASTTLADYETNGLNIHLTCSGCGKVSYRYTAKLREICHAKGIGEDVSDLATRLKCDRCGARNPSITGVRSMSP
ncbi:MAG: hypothetical protein V4530_05965 [Pseudomonadota bacterium]